MMHYYSCFATAAVKRGYSSVCSPKHTQDKLNSHPQIEEEIQTQDKVENQTRRDDEMNKRNESVTWKMLYNIQQ